jgi:hypothetical protein
LGDIKKVLDMVQIINNSIISEAPMDLRIFDTVLKSQTRLVVLPSLCQALAVRQIRGSNLKKQGKEKRRAKAGSAKQEQSTEMATVARPEGTKSPATAKKKTHGGKKKGKGTSLDRSVWNRTPWLHIR